MSNHFTSVMAYCACSVSVQVWKKATGVQTVLSVLVCIAKVTAGSWLRELRQKLLPQHMIPTPAPSHALSEQLVYHSVVLCT